RHDEAVADFSELIRRDPNVAVVYQVRGQAYLDQQDYDRAVADFDEAIRLDADDPEGHNRRAMAYCFKGDRAEALAGHLAAAERAPDDPATNNYIAWLLATSPEDDLRDGPRAVELALRVCQGTGFESAAFLDTLAAALAECGRFDEAVERARQVLELVGDGE